MNAVEKQASREKVVAYLKAQGWEQLEGGEWQPFSLHWIASDDEVNLEILDDGWYVAPCGAGPRGPTYRLRHISDR